MNGVALHSCCVQSCDSCRSAGGIIAGKVTTARPTNMGGSHKLTITTVHILAPKKGTNLIVVKTIIGVNHGFQTNKTHSKFVMRHIAHDITLKLQQPIPHQKKHKLVQNTQ